MGNNSPMKMSQLEMSPTDKRKAKYGDDNQAENLILAKEESAEKRKKHKLNFDHNEIKEESKVK